MPGRGEAGGGAGGDCSLKCPPPVEAGSEVEEAQTGITPQSEEMLLNVNNYIHLSVGPSVVDSLLQVPHLLLPANHRDCLDIDIVHTGNTAAPAHSPLTPLHIIRVNIH